MKIIKPVTLEMNSEEEPPDALLMTDSYCGKCFVVVPGHRMNDHMRAVHESAFKGGDSR